MSRICFLIRSLAAQVQEAPWLEALSSERHGVAVDDALRRDIALQLGFSQS